MSVYFRITIIYYSSRAMRIKYRKESFQITFFLVCRAKQRHNDIIKMNSHANLKISTREVLIFFLVLNAPCLSCQFFLQIVAFKLLDRGLTSQYRITRSRNRF